MAHQSSKHPGPFFRPGSSVGVLLIHGFTSSAGVFEELIDRLAKDGYTVSAPLLTGHGTTAEELAHTTAEEWYASAEKAYLELSRSCSTIFIVGASLGALLACRLGANYPSAGLVLLGTPISLEREWLIRLGTVLFPLIRKKYYEKGKTKFGIRYYEQISRQERQREEIVGGRGGHSYSKIPIASITQFLRLSREVQRNDIPRLTALPVLVVHSREDGLVSPRSAEQLLDMLPTPRKDLVWIAEPHHRLHSGNKREQMYPLIKSFLDRSQLIDGQ